MKVTITNTALLNTGDAAIFRGMHEMLKQAFGNDVRIAARDQQPAEAGHLYPDYACVPLFHDQLRECLGETLTKLHILRLLSVAAFWRTPLRKTALEFLPVPVRESLKEFAESDLVVSAGGTYLVPHYRIGPKLIEMLVARTIGCPYVLFTQSLGPFKKRQRLVRYVLQNAAAILVREEKSAAHLRAIGIRGDRVHICADAAFALSKGPRGHETTKRTNTLHIGISVRDWPHTEGDPADRMERYLNAMADLTRHLVHRHKARITFISTCQGIGSYWTDDARTADAVVSRLPPDVAEQVTVDRAFRTPEDLQARLSSFDLYVSTRMHGAILALLAGVPVLPIAYEFKTQELFASIGMKSLTQDFDTISGERLCRVSDDVLAAHDQLRARVAKEVETLRDSALSAVPLLDRSMEAAN